MTKRVAQVELGRKEERMFLDTRVIGDVMNARRVTSCKQRRVNQIGIGLRTKVVDEDRRKSVREEKKIPKMNLRGCGLSSLYTRLPVRSGVSFSGSGSRICSPFLHRATKSFCVVIREPPLLTLSVIQM